MRYKIRKVIKKSQRQLQFAGVSGWGGKRKGSGRPNRSSTVNHMRRPALNIKTPLHITLRLKDKLPSLRKKVLFREFKESIRGAKSYGLYVLQFSLQSNHFHLVAEARSNQALARGMQALAGRFAKRVRACAAAAGFGSRGSVFMGRYHLHMLKTAQEVKNALEYVLLNLSKHERLIEYIDHFSSGKRFPHWRKLLGRRFGSLVGFEEGSPEDLQDIISPPQSWLARVGWMRACG